MFSFFRTGQRVFRPLLAYLESGFSVDKVQWNDSAAQKWVILASAGVVGLSAGSTLEWNRVHGEMAPLSENEATEWSLKKWWNEFSFFSLDTRKRMFFKYEKRIRNLSTPEKVYEYFSTIDKEGVRYMTSSDLLRALVAVYPPEGSPIERGGALLGERAPSEEQNQLFQLFDLDGDNLISYHEYLMVLILLSIPIKDIPLVFDVVDLDDNGVIDRDEFEKIMEQIKKQSRQAQKSRGGLRTGLKAGQSGETGLLVKFFGENGDQKLSLPDFKHFLHDLQQKLQILEFMHYDYHNKQMIGGKDFARSLFCGGDIRSIDHYLHLVDSMDAKLADYQFNQEDFLSYYSLVHHLRTLRVALLFFESIHGQPSQQAFEVLIRRLTGQKFRPEVTELVFYIFGDEEGKLKTKDFLNSLNGRVRNVGFLPNEFAS